MVRDFFFPSCCLVDAAVIDCIKFITFRFNFAD